MKRGDCIGEEGWEKKDVMITVGDVKDRQRALGS